MSRPIIEVENLGKRFLIRHDREAARGAYRRLSEELWDAVRRRFRAAHGVKAPSETQEFWALRHVGFQVQEGEVVGIIGRNGAGKSTLLKILSRITEPTEGRVVIRGRLASLLEVGTGFHPELTGRENIYLNGSILGMTRVEINRKFEEIVAFAGIERFLDTPVKRYSSGMYVRLAFAVAAHLESEILVIDEVLAVGDVEFQRRCLAKINDVARGGRTVFFVSHNMAAIKALCTRCFVLRNGSLAFQGSVDDAIEAYMADTEAPVPDCVARRNIGKHSRILRVSANEGRYGTVQRYVAGTALKICLEVEILEPARTSVEIFIVDELGQRIAMYSSSHYDNCLLPPRRGVYRVLIECEPLWLASGRYRLDAATSIPYVAWDDVVEGGAWLDVTMCSPGVGSYDLRKDLGYGIFALRTRSSLRIEEVRHKEGGLEKEEACSHVRRAQTCSNSSVPPAPGGSARRD